MKNLKLERVGTIKVLEISEKLDEDGECFIQMGNDDAYLNKVEVQQVIDHLTELLKL